MTIKYKVGNIIEAIKNKEVDAVGHCCNCFNTMGGGVAKVLRETFPEVYEADSATKAGDIKKLGSYTHAIVEDSIIFNLYGQYNSGFQNGTPPINYTALQSSLGHMWNVLSFVASFNNKKHRIGFPKIGAGLAGGDWEVIEDMINSIFEDIDVTVYVLDESEIPS